MAKRSQVIVDDYLRQIVSGEISEGQLLPTESVLIDRYRVSRTAVREAIQTLATKGFVQIRQGSGTTVASRGRWNVLDQDYLQMTGMGAAVLDNLLQARDALEPAIAAIAAQRATAEDVSDLRALVDALEPARARSSSQVSFAELDMAFHHRLAECTDNPVLISLHASIVHLARAEAHAEAHTMADQSAQRLAFWHAQIIDAVAVGDAVAAGDAMRLHLRQVRADLCDGCG